MKFIPFFISCLLFLSCRSQDILRTGAEQINMYEKLIINKNIGLVINQTSMVDNVHLLDTLLKRSLNIIKIFSPEHGFRGKADAGEKINDNIDPKTKLQVVSLYGKNKKPQKAQLKDIDVMLFDIQDVGARFYTYISTLHYVMEACAEQNISLIVLDRPNPNGHYVDGPVLDTTYRSFVGMHPIPIVHGMTIGEYAKMINGEAWLKNKIKCELYVIKCKNYDHNTQYTLPVSPSPNLKDSVAIALYPSLCLFEGTKISVGRGTSAPFTMFGHPDISGSFSFTPRSMEGAKNPKHKSKLCYGEDLSVHKTPMKKLNLEWLISAYSQSKNKDQFFNSFFNKLAGNNTLKSAIIAGKKEEDIKKTWEKPLMAFKHKRKKYLLYPDYKQ